MALDKYRAKRNFNVTPEPRGNPGGRRRHQLSFVIQKHAARHLHYDFRLELNGVLLSWAVPKGPSLDPADKRLAMHVEDHPIEYGAFEGVIPSNQYGAGTVMLWGRGTWIPKDDAATGYADGHLKFDLAGAKLGGGWSLLRTHGSKYGGKSGKEAWLLIKQKDAYAKSGGKPIVESAPDSVATGRSLDKIAAARSHVWESKLSVSQNLHAGAIAGRKATSTKESGAASSGGGRRAPSPLPAGARRARIPSRLAPMLTTLLSTAPTGDDWLHEIKYDGYRMMCRIENGKVRIYSRNGKDWTATFGRIASDLAKLPVRNAWIDGEAVIMDASGHSSFQALQNALAEKDAEFTFFAFDLVYLDGYDLRKVALVGRKALLRQAIRDGVGAVRVGPEVQGHGDEFFRQACSMSLEGAVCKRANSFYHDGARTRDWVKVKCTRRQEMVIGGYTKPQGARSGFGALLLGVQENGKLRYAGRVGTGFTERALKEIYALLVKRTQEKPPFVNPPRGYEAKGARWVKPDLVAEIAFTEWSNAGALRHPSFQGLRADKKASEVVRETPQTEAKGATPIMAPTVSKSNGTQKKADAAMVAGIAISHPEKLYFPESGITKREIAAFYERIAPWILPHIKGRPLSLVRCPDGWKGQCFYQKHAERSVSAAVDRITVPEGGGSAVYMGAGNAKALVALVQWGVIEMHPWGSQSPRLDRPDRLIFDFDPDDAVPWKDLVAGIELLRTMLHEFDLQGFLKTTGGKGLHVVVPIRPTLDWEQAKGFTRSVAAFLVRTFGDRFTASVSKSKRTGKIFIDYLRNAEGSTAIAPYGVRARAGAPVAMPIAWEELAKDVRFDFFNVRNAERRLSAQKRDPWRDFATIKQAITKAHGKRVGFSL